jgi:hypothetical protein
MLCRLRFIDRGGFDWWLVWDVWDWQWDNLRILSEG